ncbi:uncharacterized protein LOC111406737 [Olea europaea var. sylvestris]|uniref:uncharacterized protein LOC111406737 n=1 Tax=Olea europaea var. sylvestris TaxID=158386 RepID=UPI000C1CE31D|nr:uncharacterized protein LOC111406737 [Olea europaea var. sylvestris]
MNEIYSSYEWSTNITGSLLRDFTYVSLEVGLFPMRTGLIFLNTLMKLGMAQSRFWFSKRRFNVKHTSIMHNSPSLPCNLYVLVYRKVERLEVWKMKGEKVHVFMSPLCFGQPDSCGRYSKEVRVLLESIMSGVLNYASWKVRMRPFLKSLDEHVWVSVQNGWKPPSTTVSGTINLTDISLWTKDEIAECNWNSKGLHALFMAVSPKEFRRVSMCETAKEVWDILETTHEGTKTVKNSKLQMLASRFEEVRMKDDETFDEFYAKLNDIVNSSFNLGERIPESKIKGKSVALKSIKEDESSDTESLRDDEIAYFVKRFQKVLKNRKKPHDRKSGAPSSFSKEKIEKFTNKGSSDKPRLVRSHEYNESETSDRQESSSSENEGNYMAFVSTIKSESDKESNKVEEELPNDNSSNEDEDDIDIQEAYQLLFKESLKIKKKLDNILGMNKPAGDRKGLGYVKGNTHVTRPSKTVFVSASKKANAVGSSKKGKNVPREQSHQSRRNFNPRYPQTRTFEPRFIPTCHHCGALGHTRPRCYKLGNEHRNHNIPSQVSFLSNQVSHLTEMLTKLTRSTLSSTKVWVKKGDLARHSGQENCFVAHVALKAQNYNMWYLDSACSRHMCGNKALFTTLDECNGGMVTFGDGGSAPILGKGTVQMHGLPVISNVLYVEGLKSNLLSISQICDDDFEVSFVQKRCTVYDSSGGVVLEGVRTSDNCYGVLPNSNYVCRSAKIDVSELWHKRLGHLNYKSLVQLAKKELVDGLPKISPSENVVCGPCQLGKQFKGSHKKTSKILIKRPMELIHMDLMGPSRTESLGGKRYIIVVVDDFSRFTWIELLREKSDVCDLIKSLYKRLSNELNLEVSRMRSDHGKEFENSNLESFCMDEGILHEFSSPITPQQNGGKKPTVKYFRVFGSKCYILRDRENLGKFESKSDEGVFLGYSRNSRAFRVYNSRTHVVMESINVVIDDAVSEGESVENCDRDGDLISSSDPTEPPVSESSLRKIETPEKETLPQD